MPPETRPGRLDQADDEAEAAWAVKRCARCDKGFRCGADTPSCWCDSGRLSAEQRARLAGLGLVGCLCRECLRSL